MRVLITSGATREPIDQIRFISNHSSGETARIIAETFAEMGHEVVFLHGMSSQIPKNIKNIISFESFQDLDRKIQTLLSTQVFHEVIHAAAIGDYSVAEIVIDGKSFKPLELTKIDSKSAPQIRLSRNFKIVSRLLAYSRNPQLKISAFKLTHTSQISEQKLAVKSLFQYPGVFRVIHNDFGRITETKNHDFQVYENEVSPFYCKDKDALAHYLVGKKRALNVLEIDGVTL